MTADPLGYPGHPLTRSGLIVDREFREGVVTELAGRQPVLAVGSNASLPVLRSKLSGFTSRLEIPITAVVAHNLAVGVSGHVSRPGYVPATPVEMFGTTTRLVVCWFDEQQLAAVDATEPNYDRVQLPVEHFGVDAHAYVSRNGHVVDRNGAARRLTSQRELIAALLGQSEALRDLAGDTPQAFVVTMQDASARAAAAEVFRAEGWVRAADQLSVERRAGRTSSPN